LNITVHKKGSLAHQEVLGIFAKSRIYIGLSMSDGISTSLLEAMSMGAFPIQTNTSCADEWVVDGMTGILIREINSETVSNAMLKALIDNELIDGALAANQIKIFSKANPAALKASARTFYGL
jgi:glycosyltransferase involved in cell wall biosynthesis